MLHCAGISIFRKNSKTGLIQTILVKTSTGHFSMPKGKRHAGESYLECALRETKEECGVTDDMLVPLVEVEEGKEYYSLQEKSIIYYPALFVGDDNFKLTCEDPEELEEVNWYNVDDILRLDDTSIKKARKDIIKTCYDIILDTSKAPSKVEYRFELDKVIDNNNKIDKMDKQNVELSKRMTYELRHNLPMLKQKHIRVENDGSVPLNDFIKYLKESDARIREVVDTNEKKRFFIKTLDDGTEHIGASQGHSTASGTLINPENLLERIDDPLPVLFHGTFNKHLGEIKKSGLNKMSRQHIHLTDSFIAVSGVKQNSQAYVFIDMEQAMNDGIIFYRSKNGVILTEGINGVIDPKYIKKITGN